MADLIGGVQPGGHFDVTGIEARRAAAAAGTERVSGLDFGAYLESASGLTFSGHAARRIEERGVPMDEERLRRLQSAVDRAEAKGSRDSLILLDDLALVVSIKNHTVVTAVDEASQKERVFTNIDSVVIAD